MGSKSFLRQKIEKAKKQAKKFYNELAPKVKTFFDNVLVSLKTTWQNFCQALKKFIYNSKGGINLFKESVPKFFKKLFKNISAFYAKFLKEKIKFIKDMSIIIFIYGGLVNYLFTYFLGFDLNLKSVIAFGLCVYFIKYEIVNLIIAIRGPKSPPFMLMK
jgi:hypothetical protein